MRNDFRRVLLTGGNGLVGKTLAPLLRERGEVTHFEMADPGDGLPFVQGDLRDWRAIGAACQGMDAVIHVAALHGRAWEEAGEDVGFEVNVVGTKNLLEGAAAAGVRRVVFTSSIWATGHGPQPPYLPIDEQLPRQPSELYGLTKLLGEQMCRYATAAHGLSTICLRPGGIRPAEAYGPDDVSYLGAAVDVRDVAQAHLLSLAALSAIEHEVFVITADSPLCRVSPERYRADPVAALASVAPGTAELPAFGALKLDPEMEWYAIDKARRLLGYAPRYNFELLS